MISTKQLKDLACYLVSDTLYPVQSLVLHWRRINSSLHSFPNGKNKHKIEKMRHIKKGHADTSRPQGGKHFSSRQMRAYHFQRSIQCWVIGVFKMYVFHCPTPVLCILRDLQPTVNTHSLLARQPRSFYRNRNTATEKNLIIGDKSGNTPLLLNANSRYASKNKN